MDSRLLDVSTVQTTIWVRGLNAAEVDHREVLPRHPGSRTDSFTGRQSSKEHPVMADPVCVCVDAHTWAWAPQQVRVL